MSARSINRFGFLAVLIVGLTILAGCGGGGGGDSTGSGEGEASSTESQPTENASTVDPSCDVEAAAVAVQVHFKSPFTQRYIQGAEAAAADCNASINSAGPNEIDTPVQIREFGDLVSTGAKAIVTVAYPANLWVKPIDQAVEKGVEVGTVDVASPGSQQLVMASAKSADYGRDLATILIENKSLGANPSGEIVTGNCFPGLDVLEQELLGFKEVIEEELPNVTVADPIDVTFEPASNYAAWKRLMEENPDALAVYGVCDGDVDNQLRVRQEATDPKWIIGGLNYDPISLEGLKNGEVAALVDGQPFMAGYTSMRTLLTKIAGGEVPRGWIDTGTETTTQENVQGVIEREEAADEGFEVPREAYAKQIEAIFADLPSHVQPFAEYVKP